VLFTTEAKLCRGRAALGHAGFVVIVRHTNVRKNNPATHPRDGLDENVGFFILLMPTGVKGRIKNHLPWSAIDDFGDYFAQSRIAKRLAMAARPVEPRTTAVLQRVRVAVRHSWTLVSPAHARQSTLVDK
jgi:hypothetical protein